jgi:hypothetical protein
MEVDGRFFGFFRPVIDAIFFWDKNHCYESYKSETIRALFVKDHYNK